MTYTYQAWPAWCHGPKGESAIFNSEDEIPKGWTHHRKGKTAPEKPAKATHSAPVADPHADPHNVPSASEEAVAESAKAPTAAEGKEEIDGLRAHYKKVVGKKPFMGWSADQLREKLDETEGK